VIDRFVQAVSEAVTEAGGRANHFTGDGLIAAFGLACAPREACRQALAAVAGIGRNVAALNHALLGEMAEPIRFGVGVHGSVAVVGEIGFAEARVFTTLGDPANLATRLEQLCKQFACEAVVSDAVCRLSGRDLEYLPLHQAALRGRTAALPARLNDISVGGASLRGGPALPQGTAATLHVDGTGLTVPCVVHASDDDLLRLRFALDDATAAKVLDTVERLGQGRAA